MATWLSWEVARLGIVTGEGQVERSWFELRQRAERPDSGDLGRDPRRISRLMA